MSDSNYSESRHWKSRPEDIAWAGWDDSYVAYHRPSGRTHFLNSSSFFLISEYLQVERNLDEIVDSLAPGAPEGDTTVLSQEVQTLLQRLERAGLIDCV